MFSSLRKLFRSCHTRVGVSLHSAESKCVCEEKPAKVERPSGWRLFSSRKTNQSSRRLASHGLDREEKVERPHGCWPLFSSRNQSSRRFATKVKVHGTKISLFDCTHHDQTWARTGMRVCQRFGRVPERHIPPDVVRGVQFVLDTSGKPICLGSGTHGSVFLVQWQNVLRALKVTYKDKSCDWEVLREASLLRFVSPCQATPEFFGLVGIKSKRHCGYGMLMEFVGDEDGKSHTLYDLLWRNTLQLSPSEWRRGCLKLCRHVRALQKLGIRLIDLKPDNILVHPQDKRFIITDLGLARYRDTHLHFVNGMTPEANMSTFPYVAPELFLTGVLHENTDTYSLAKVVQDIALYGLDLELNQVDRILKPFLRFDPTKRLRIPKLKKRIRLHFKVPKPSELGPAQGEGPTLME